MSASEAKKIERNSPFERGVATTGRQDREPSTDGHNPLGNPPTTLNHAADLEAARVTLHPVNELVISTRASAAVAAACMDRQTLPPSTPGMQGERCNRRVLMLPS